MLPRAGLIVSFVNFVKVEIFTRKISTEGRNIYQKDFNWYISGEPILNNSSEYPSNVWNYFPNVVLLKSFE